MVECAHIAQVTPESVIKVMEVQRREGRRERRKKQRVRIKNREGMERKVPDKGGSGCKGRKGDVACPHLDGILLGLEGEDDTWDELQCGVARACVQSHDLTCTVRAVVNILLYSSCCVLGHTAGTNTG